ncbi:unnamed protein product [Symbiodinium microadriaticum]|nr:unnamed protein product [Symbiodinium microadriaticum]
MAVTGACVGQRTGSSCLGSPFFPESGHIQREQAAASAELLGTSCPVDPALALSASPNLPRASPIHLEQWKAVSRGLAGIFQDATPGSCASAHVLTGNVAGPQSPASASPWSPWSPKTPVSPASPWNGSPVVVEQWQTVGKRLASVFQDDGLWATTPTASSPDWHRPAPR